MFKVSFLVLALAVVACSSEPLRSQVRSNRRLARQEEAPAPAPAPAPTGYPEAGITPEIPFDLPTSTAQPDNTYLPPDNTEQPDNTYLPPETPAGEDLPEVPVPDNEEPAPVDEPAIDEEPQDPEEPEESSGDDIIPDDALLKEQNDIEEDDVVLTLADDGTVIAVSNTFDQNAGQTGRLVYQRFPQARRRPSSPSPQFASARLTQKRRRVAPAKMIILKK